MDIESLLKKKNWKGEEVGQALLLNLAADYAPVDDTPRLSQSDLDVMVAALESEKDKWDYTACALLYKSLSAARTWADTCQLQLHIGHLQCRLYLGRIEADQQLRGALLNGPAVLPEAEFNRRWRDIRAARAARQAGYAEILWGALAFYTGQYARRKPDTPPVIKDILDGLTPFELGWLLQTDPWERTGEDYELLGARYPALFLALRQDVDGQEFLKPLAARVAQNPGELFGGEGAQSRLSWGDLAEHKLYIYPRMLRQISASTLVRGCDEGQGARLSTSSRFDEIRAKNGAATLKAPRRADLGKTRPAFTVRADDTLALPDALTGLLASEGHAEGIRTAREDFLWGNARWLLAFNRLVALLAEQYQLPGLAALAVGEQDILPYCREVQQQVESLAAGLADTERPAGEKRHEFALLFPKYSGDPLALHPAGCEAAKAHLQRVRRGTEMPGEMILLINEMARTAEDFGPLPPAGEARARQEEETHG